MRSALALQTFLGTERLGFRIAARAFARTTNVTCGYPVRVNLGAQSVREAFGNSTPRSLIAVRSLPYSDGIDTAFVVAEQSRVSPSRVIGLGDQCAAIIDGLGLAASFASSGLSPVALVAADQFSEAVDTEAPATTSGLSEWRNMAGCLRVEAEGSLRLLAIATISDPTLAPMTMFNGKYLAVDQKLASAFRAIDLDAQLETIQALLPLHDTTLGKPILCLTNRSSPRTHRLRQHFEDRITICESRKKYGHTGGADILANLAAALDLVGTGSGTIICSANGLGYTWSAMLIEKAAE